jgi:hypothetical protein
MSIHASRSRWKYTGTTPFLEVSQSFIGPLRLHNNRPIPPRVNKHVLRLRDRYSRNLCLTTGVGWWRRILPSRRPDGERRPVNPTYYVMIGSLRSAQKALSADKSSQNKERYARLSSDPILKQLQIRSNLLSPRVDIDVHDRITDRWSRAYDPMEIGRRERQSREILW